MKAKNGLENGLFWRSSMLRFRAPIRLKKTEVRSEVDQLGERKIDYLATNVRLLT
jgi:hypothetical protein